MSTAIPPEVVTPLAQFPLILRWRSPESPLPVRAVRAPTRSTILGLEAPPWWNTGPIHQPFDFCGHIRRLCQDMVARVEELRHVDVSRLLFAMTQARSGRTSGLQARVTPLRFPQGALLRHRRGVTYQVQRYFVDDHEMLYLITFCLPRFLDQSFEEKFITLFHELYHVSPKFDGDLRRHGGRCDLHLDGKKAFDLRMAQIARAYLDSGADPALSNFLRLNFAQLQHRHGSVVSVVVPRPKQVPVSIRKAQ